MLVALGPLKWVVGLYAGDSYCQDGRLLNYSIDPDRISPSESHRGISLPLSSMMSLIWLVADRLGHAQDGSL